MKNSFFALSSILFLNAFSLNVFGVSPDLLYSQEGVSIQLDYKTHVTTSNSQNQEQVTWADPLTFTVTYDGLKSSDQLTLVFISFEQFYGTNNCGHSGSRQIVYELKLTPNAKGTTFVGNLKNATIDGIPLTASARPLVLRTQTYCQVTESKSQEMALVVNGVWQTANKNSGSHNFELHLSAKPE